MPITFSITIAQSHVQSNGKRRATHYFTDHLDKVTTRKRDVEENDGLTEYAILRTSMEQDVLDSLAEGEIQDALSRMEAGGIIDTVPDHQPQANFDRRVLGRAMLFDSYEFYNGYIFYQRVRSEGNTTSQRATYLGISNTEWLQIETRFSTIEAWDIELEKVQQWTELPESFS